MGIKDLNIDKSWTLFLDRDGVINRKLPDDYVKKISEFNFLEKSPEAIAALSKIFGTILIVTNQQGIGKKLMKVEDLNSVHKYMLSNIKQASGRIDKIYFCPELEENNSIDRKPNIGMAKRAKEDFPQINFEKSVMVGDSFSDLQFGKKSGMKTVYVAGSKSRFSDGIIHEADYIVSSLWEFCERLK